MKIVRTLLVAPAAVLLLAATVRAQTGQPARGGRGAPPAPAAAQQNTALNALNTQSQSELQAVTDARDALTQASFGLPANPADLQTKAQALAEAELALALVRADAFTRIQASPDRFNIREVRYMINSAINGGALVAQVGGGRGGAPGGQPRPRLLIWADTRNGIAQHDFTSHAMAVIERLGYDSKLYDTYIRTDSDIISFNPKMTTGGPASGGPSLANVDAIFSLVHREAPLPDSQKQELLRFVREGGGFVTAHTGLTAFLSWPEFRAMIGGGYGGHSIGYPHTLVVEDPNFPGASAFPARVDMSDEWYTLTDYSRDIIHVVLRLDLSDMDNPPASVVASGGDFPVAWARTYGRGRVFASTFAHATESWDDPRIQTLYFEAIKWALGITDADVTPQPFKPIPAEAARFPVDVTP